MAGKTRWSRAGVVGTPGAVGGLADGHGLCRQRRVDGRRTDGELDERVIRARAAARGRKPPRPSSRSNASVMASSLPSRVGADRTNAASRGCRNCACRSSTHNRRTAVRHPSLGRGVTSTSARNRSPTARRSSSTSGKYLYRAVGSQPNSSPRARTVSCSAPDLTASAAAASRDASPAERCGPGHQSNSRARPRRSVHTSALHGSIVLPRRASRYIRSSGRFFCID